MSEPIKPTQQIAGIKSSRLFSIQRVAFDALRVASVKIQNTGDNAVLIYTVVMAPSGVISQPIRIAPYKSIDPDFTEERRVQIKKYIHTSEVLQQKLDRSSHLKKLIYTPR